MLVATYLNFQHRQQNCLRYAISANRRLRNPLASDGISVVVSGCRGTCILHFWQNVLIKKQAPLILPGQKTSGKVWNLSLAMRFQGRNKLRQARFVLPALGLMEFRARAVRSLILYEL